MIFIRKNFNIYLSADELKDKNIIPLQNESTRLISAPGQWSSCALLVAINEKDRIEELYATTLRVGKKEAVAIASMNIKRGIIACGGIAQEGKRKNGKDYGYSQTVDMIFADTNIKTIYKRNHSKVILLKLKSGTSLVIETSSNLNENPQIEQFCITNSEMVFNFYFSEYNKLEVFD